MPTDRKLFIARHGNGKTIGIVVGDDRRVVYAYFAGRGQTPHVLDEIDLAGLDLSAIGLIKVFMTRERTIRNDRGLPETILVEE